MSAPQRDRIGAESATASLLHPSAKVAEATRLSPVKLVGLIVACVLPAVVLVLRDRDPARARVKTPR